MIISHRDIGDLDVLLRDTANDEIVVETDKARCVLRRLDDNGWVEETTLLAEPVLLSEGARVEAIRPQAARADDGRLDVLAPLPGIFYRAPNPGAAPFVAEGARVSTDMVVGIIETMKLMNSVAAGVVGTIVEICVANGTQVEAQDVLMRVEGP